MERRDFFVRACMVLGENTPNPDTSPRPMLSHFFLNRLNANPDTDPRKVLLEAMKEIRDAMQEVKEEMNGIDSIGM